MAKMISEWDATLRTHEFHPFKMVQVGNDMWEEVIDVTNKELVMLRKELGPAVCDSVTNALKEIQTYNATGRYIVEVPWNYTTNEEATMKDILLQLQDIIIERDKKPPPKRKTNLKSKLADTRW